MDEISITAFDKLSTKAALQETGIEYLDKKRGWKNFILGKKITDVPDLKEIVRGRTYKYIGTCCHVFLSADVEEIILVIDDFGAIIGIIIELGEVCSADFRTDTKYITIKNQLEILFGPVTSAETNENLGEFGFQWSAKKTELNFETKWISDSRIYKGKILFIDKVFMKNKLINEF